MRKFKIFKEKPLFHICLGNNSDFYGTNALNWAETVSP